MASNKEYNSQDQSQYILNDVELWNKIKELQPVIMKIVEEGIDTKEEKQIARGVCSFILSQICYEQSKEAELRLKQSNLN